MNYFLNEVVYRDELNATSKAREDIADIFRSLEYKEILINPTGEVNGESPLQKMKRYKKNVKEVINTIKTLKKDDVLFFQYPLLGSNIIYLNKIINSCKSKIIFVVHDLDYLRLNDSTKLRKLKLKYYKKITLKHLNKVSLSLIHNENMLNYLIENGVKKEKMHIFGLMDYLSDNLEFNTKDDDAVIIAGNLSYEKANYIYKLPENVKFNVYGVGYDDKKVDKNNIHYKGSFTPNKLLEIVEGKFGLIWDGESIDKCVGQWGKYLRYNNPHKTSLYLACGLPVIAHIDTAIAKFITKEKCGITISTLSELHDKIESLSNEEYKIIRENAKKIGLSLRKGDFLRKAFAEAANSINK